MFDNFLKDTVRIYFGISLGIITALLITLGLNAFSDKPVGAYDMPNGVICYTHWFSIDCLQVEK